MLGEVQAEDALDVDAGSGGDIDRSNDIKNESLGAFVILAGIFQNRVEYRADLIAQVERKPTELGKDVIEPLVQGADYRGDVGVGAADENVGGDGSGEDHGTTGENRKDSGETHSD